MDQREFMDKLYQMWSKTTNAEDRFWDYTGGGDNFTISSVGSDGDTGLPVAQELFEHDADWITAIHGAFPEVFRRFLEALDQAERSDTEVDVAYGRLAAAEMRVDELSAALAEELALVAELQSDLEGLINR